MVRQKIKTPIFFFLPHLCQAPPGVILSKCVDLSLFSNLEKKGECESNFLKYVFWEAQIESLVGSMWCRPNDLIGALP